MVHPHENFRCWTIADPHSVTQSEVTYACAIVIFVQNIYIEFA